MFVSRILFFLTILMCNNFIPLIYIIFSLFLVCCSFEPITSNCMSIYAFLCLTNCKIIKVKESKKLIDKGIILGNHRGWVDMAIDNYLCEGNVVFLIRRLAGVAITFACIDKLLCKTIIIIGSKNLTRHDIIKKIVEKVNTKRRVLFYPEGTRLRYSELKDEEDLKSKLKYGLLKSVYENQDTPVQVVISSNKEKVMDEFRLKVNRNITVKSCFGEKILPSEYATFEDFIDKIACDWYRCWKLTHLEKIE